jgi:hypothetical protein
MNDTQEIYELEIRIKVKGTTKEELEKEIIKFKDA